MREKPKYGPTRGEMIFRTAFSTVGLAILLGILIFQGIPSGPAFFEVVIIGVGFFGGSFGWSLYCLATGHYRDS